MKRSFVFSSWVCAAFHILGDVMQRWKLYCLDLCGFAGAVSLSIYLKQRLTASKASQSPWFANHPCPRPAGPLCIIYLQLSFLFILNVVNLIQQGASCSLWASLLGSSACEVEDIELIDTLNFERLDS